MGIWAALVTDGKEELGNSCAVASSIQDFMTYPNFAFLGVQVNVGREEEGRSRLLGLFLS
jgi:hypothetical protein